VFRAGRDILDRPSGERQAVPEVPPHALQRR
jgi:hypothetical protein